MARMGRITLLIGALAIVGAACSSADVSAPETTSSLAATTTTEAVTTTAAPATTIQASDPTEILILGEWTNTVDGKFVASGGVVDAGDFCPGGRYKFKQEITDEEPGEWQDFLGVAEYTCGDGSGSFTIEGLFHSITEPGGNVTIEGSWDVVGGTDAYATLGGTGTLTALCLAVGGCGSEMTGNVSS